MAFLEQNSLEQWHFRTKILQNNGSLEQKFCRTMAFLEQNSLEQWYFRTKILWFFPTFFKRKIVL
jgi:hypothetical protein